MRKTDLQEDDFVIATMKKRYFDLVAKENYPKTPDITKEADNIEKAIRELQSKSNP